MQFSKFLKVAAVAFPLIAVTACSSNSSSNAGGNGSLSKEALEQLQKLQQTNTVYFDYDKYNVKSEYTTLLNAHAVCYRLISPSQCYVHQDKHLAYSMQLTLV